jgi:hypothetical protein
MTITDGSNDLLGTAVLAAKIASTGFKCLCLCILIREKRQDDDSGLRILGSNYTGRFQSVHLRQPYIDEQHVRLVLLDYLDCSNPITGFGYHKKIGLPLKQTTKGLTIDGMVIYECDFDHGDPLSGGAALESPEMREPKGIA